MRVKREQLLLIAGLVWTMAGGNVLRLGVEAAIITGSARRLADVFACIAVFAAFHFLVFSGLVRKHTRRMMNDLGERPFFWQFFDRKSFLIMAGMILFGVLLRRSPRVSSRFIAFFYTGLGSALTLAGLLFVAARVRLFRVKDEGRSRTERSVSDR